MERLNHIYREPKRMNAQLRITMDCACACVCAWDVNYSELRNRANGS